MNEVDIRVASAFSRAVTRRVFMRRAIQSAFVAGVSLSGVLKFSKPAHAWGCTPGGTVNNWGCYCAGTQSCGTSKCGYGSGTCQGGATKRCNYWSGSGSGGGYCWCSQNCCVGGWTGYYSCCDCWMYGSSGCSTGNTACICKQRVVFVPC